MAERGPVGLILDFDGVIVESVDIKTLAFRQLFAGYPEHLDAIVAHHEAHAGVSRYEKFRVIFRDILRQPCDEALMRRLGAQFSALVMEEVIRCPFVRGAEAFLAEFGARYALFVVSGTPQNELREVVRRRRLEGSFHDVLGAPRTKVEIMRGILTVHGWAPGALIAVGDSQTDLRAARALGIPFIGRRSAGELNPFDGATDIPIVADLTELSERWDRLIDREAAPAPAGGR